MLTKTDIDLIGQIIDSKIDTLKEDLFGNLPTKEEFFNSMDELMGN